MEGKAAVMSKTKIAKNIVKTHAQFSPAATPEPGYQPDLDRRRRRGRLDG